MLRAGELLDDGAKCTLIAAAGFSRRRDCHRCTNTKVNQSQLVMRSVPEQALAQAHENGLRESVEKGQEPSTVRATSSCLSADTQVCTAISPLTMSPPGSIPHQDHHFISNTRKRS